MNNIEELLEDLNPKQREAATKIDGKYLVLAGAGSGKALVNGSKVQTPNGPTNIENLKIGDFVFGADGKACQVKGVFPQGQKQVYEVEFSDGSIVLCNDEHLWTYQTASMRSNARGWKTSSLREIMDNVPLKTKSGVYERFNVYIPMAEPVQYEKKQLPMHPYLLGALLGDGYLRQAGQMFSNPEKDVLLKVKNHLSEFGYTLKHISKNDYSIKMIENKVERHKKQYFSQTLFDLGLLGSKSNTKFIPSIYKLSSIEDRIALLRGLIDTDGHFTVSQYEYSTSSEQLSKDVKELAQSLGLSVLCTTKDSPSYSYLGESKVGMKNYRLFIKMSSAFQKLHSSDKHESKWKMGQSVARRTIRAIRETNEFAEMTCISVNNEDELFLTDNFIVTHNTRVLTKRIAYLTMIGVKPWEIVAISFTRKASNEIIERVKDMIGETALDVNMGTFHSLCMRILIKNQGALGMSNMTILDETEAKKIIFDIAMTYGFVTEDAQYEIKGSIDRWGNEGWTSADVRAKGNVPKDMIDIFEEYSSFKRSVGYVDFNDILSLTSELFRIRPDILEAYSSKYKYIMVDEVQDTNNVQFRLLQQLSSYHQNYVIFGDDLQCVYSFRGSNIDNMMNIRKFDKDVQTILLEQNYRSSDNIVKASNGFIANNKKQLEKISYTDNDDGAPIFIYDSVDETKEADFVVAMIEGLVKTKGASYDDFAVLYRSNYQSRNIEFAFSRVGIPYGVVGGSEFYERDEVKTLVSYLRALDNEMDDLAYNRILNKPKRGLGDASLNRIKMYASTGNIPFSKAMEHIADIDKINKPSKAKILDIVNMIQKGREIARRPNASVVELLRYIILETKFMDQYDTDRSAHVECIQNIQELWNVANSFDTREHEDLEEGQTILTQFLTETALYVKPTDKEEQAVVSLTTAHSAKGLEYKYVFVIGVQAGTFPSRLSQSDADYEEERRLFYVSMTRAKDILFLSFNRKRYVRGQTVDSGPSRFIGEIPSQYVRYLGVKKQEE